MPATRIDPRSRAYIGSAEGEQVMRTRLGAGIAITSAAYGEVFSITSDR